MRASGIRVTTASVMAEKTLDTATPARIMVSLEAPVFSAMKRTSMTPQKAPMKAATGVYLTAVGMKAMAVATAQPAAELTPIILGAARGLERTFWMITPATASPEPTVRQPRALGSLT